MLGVGEKFPSFSLIASVGIEQDPATAFKVTTDLDYGDKWKVYFFWPRDFSPASATDIVSFARLNQQFQEQGAQILGGSIDSEWAHRAWRNSQPELNDLAFPMLADIKRELCGQLGILDPAEGVPQRATFIVDPAGVIQFVCVLAGSMERNADEVLRVLHGLHSIHVSRRERQQEGPAKKTA
jgi:lipoyl-dependent peroxiredoxin subunit C